MKTILALLVLISGLVATQQMSLADSITAMNCTDIETKNSSLQTCLQGMMSPDEINFDMICDYLEDIVQCYATAVTDCVELQNTKLEEIAALVTLVTFLDCPLQIQNHIYSSPESVCNLRKNLECSNPLLSAIGYETVGDNTNITGLRVKLETIDFLQPQNIDGEFDRDEICGPIISDIESSSKCVLKEYLKCSYDDLFMGSSDETEENMDLLMMTMAKIKGEFVSLYQVLDTAGAQLELYCDSDCVDFSMRVNETVKCTRDNDAKSVMQFISGKHNDNQNHDLECRSLRDVFACTEEFAAGCDVTENVLLNELFRPETQQIIDLCDASLSYLDKPRPLACSSGQYTAAEKFRVENICEDVSLELEKLVIKSGVTQQEICQKVKNIADCYSYGTFCCENRKYLLEPRFHTWALYNQWFDCNIWLGDRGLLVSPKDESTCNYNNVLSCYSPLLSKVGLDVENMDQMNITSLKNIFQLKTFFWNNTDQCPDDNTLGNIESCVHEEASGCSFYSTCMHSGVIRPTIFPLSDMVYFSDVRDTCDGECDDVDMHMDMIEICDVEKSIHYIASITWEDMIGANTTQQCDHLKAISDCMKMSIGSCKVLIKHAKKQLGLTSISSINLTKYAASVCDVSLDYLQFFDPTETSERETTTPVVTTGSANVKLSFVLFGVTLGSTLVCLFWNM